MRTANPLQKPHKELVLQLRKDLAKLVQDTANAKACGCNVDELEADQAALYDALEALNKYYVGAS